MTRRFRLSLLALTLLAGALPVASPIAPEPVQAAETGGCVVEIIVLPGGEQATRINCEGNDDLEPVTTDTTDPAIYPPYCATGTRAFVTPRSYDKQGRVLAKDGSGNVVAGGYGWEPTSVAAATVRQSVARAVADQLSVAYTKARIGSPVMPNSFYWRALAPDLIAAYLQVENLPGSMGGGGALVRRNLTERLTQIIPYDSSASKSSPYFTDGGYLQRDEFGKATEFALANGAANLTTALTTVGSPVWTLPVGKGASNLQLLPTATLTSSSIAGIPTPKIAVESIRNFWRGFALADRPVSVKEMLSYNWGDQSGWGTAPFSTTAQVKTAVSRSFLTEAQVGGGAENGSVKLPIKMMYRVESYAPVTRAVAWREYKQVWVPPSEEQQQVCTNVGGRLTCTIQTVTVPGYYKWVATGAVVGSPSATWIAAPGYPQPSGSATTQWRPVNKVVGYQIQMGADTWATSGASFTSGLKGTTSGLSGLLANPRYDANSPGGRTLLRRLEGAWWPVGVIPAIKNSGDMTVAAMRKLLDDAVLRQLGRDTNGDKRITATEGMTYGQRARWYTASGSTITPGLANTLMLPAFRAPSVVLTGSAQSGAPTSAGDRAIAICGNPIKVMDFGRTLGKLAAQPLPITLVTGPDGGAGGVPMQRMGMVLNENGCRTSNISRASQYGSQLSSFPGSTANDTVGAACWVSWGLYRIPLPFVKVSSDIQGIFEYYRVKRTGVCPNGAPTCDRWKSPVLDAAAVVGKPYKIEGALGTPTSPNPPASYLNVRTTKSGFVGDEAYISASQIGISLEIGKLCRVTPGNDLVRYCGELTDSSGKPLPGRLIARINRDANGYPVSVVFDRTPLSRLNDPDCRSLSSTVNPTTGTSPLLEQCGIGYDAKSGNYFFRIRVRTWWNGVISHGLADWPKPLGLFSNLLFSNTNSVNDESFDYLRSWGSPANLGLSDRYINSLTFAKDAPPVTSPWRYGNGSPAPTPPAPRALTDAPVGAWAPNGWGSYWLCSRYATGAQAALCPVSSGSPEYRRWARPLFDAAMACNPDGSLSTLIADIRSGGVTNVTAASKEDCFLDIPVVSSQPGAN